VQKSTFFTNAVSLYHKQPKEPPKKTLKEHKWGDGVLGLPQGKRRKEGRR